MQQAIRTLRTLLPLNGSVTVEQIENAVNGLSSIPQYSTIDKEALIREAQAIYNIRIDDFSIIESHERRRPWVNEKKASIWNIQNQTFWGRYKDYLQIEKNFSNSTIDQLDRLTERVLDGLFDPSINAAINKYGLVAGQVQSGKTSNYTGLICKAADAGYKLIIVLAGIHNNLRSQTQLRLDEGFLGFNTKYAQAFNQVNDEDIWIGVGKISRSEIAHSITSCRDNGDFSQGAFNSLGLNFNTNEPIIAVVKKNSRVLDRLLTWLSAQAVEVDGKKTIRNKSLLLIDDEADNASINTNPETDKTTRINGLIRDVIRLFEKSGYIGYTATPFANIFIPIVEDDLFPRDFIINLPAPSNYIGPDKVFGFQPLEESEISETVLPIVRKIDDYLTFVPDRHKKADLDNWKTREEIPQNTVDKFCNDAPESLVTAIKSFIVTCTVRRLRGHTSAHNSMLIHITRFQNWQKLVCKVVEEKFSYYKRGIEMNIPQVIEEIRQTFEEDTGSYKSYKTTSQQILDSDQKNTDPNIKVHQWDEVLPHLNEAVSRIQVREINGGSADALNYFDHKNGLSVIAIGGDKLSRGLTLEGLSISYYLRASKMYDTLMQMGRWFGYRPGYVDLCRLFTSRELNEWFCHITRASEELRNEFDYMSDVAGSVPEQYALRVRTHPGVLQISASNKIRRAVTVDISWAGRLVESYEFTKNPETIHSNLVATNTFIDLLPHNPQVVKNHYLWKDVPFQNVKALLQKFRLSESLKAADPGNLLRFIDAQVGNKELTNWSVAIMSKKSAASRTMINKNGSAMDIGFFIRNCDEKNSDDEIYYLRKSHIISPQHEFIDLTDEEWNKAMETTKRLWQTKNKEGDPSYPNGEVVRNEIRHPNNPLLLIYFLDPVGANLPATSEPIIGYAISFPKSRFDIPASFAVHEQLLPIFYQDDNSEEVDDDED